MSHLPTVVVGQGGEPAPPPGPAPGAGAYGAGPYGGGAYGGDGYGQGAYGHPQQHPQPPAYGYPYSGHGANGTPPYGPPPFPAQPQPYGPPHQPGRDNRSTALLVVIALVVALAAGGSVYALMSGARGDDRAGGDPSTPAAPSTPHRTGDAGTGDAGATDDAPPTESGPPTSDAPEDGTVPAEFLGNWSGSIDNDSGSHSRRLTVQQGEVGDTVMSLVADGPTGSGTYHCVFEARLTGTSGGRLRLGPSTVTTGEPRSACTPAPPARSASSPTAPCGA